MKRYSVKAGTVLEVEKVDAFLEEIVAVCEKHGLALSHEDHHGAFEVVDLDADILAWIREAHDARRLA